MNQNQKQNQIMNTESNSISGALTVKECWNMATVLAQSTIVPKDYQGNTANCFVALEMSQRMGASPMMVMQNLYTINGRPSWSSPFIISTINTCGKFKTPIQYHVEGSGNNLSCYAYATAKDGTVCKGTKITMQMAIDEGWVAKNGSKWKTMPEHMIRYRAAAFFGRQFAPELLMGMRSVEEAIELGPEEFTVVTETKVEEEIKTNANTGEIVDIPEETKKEQTKEEPKQVNQQPQVQQQSLFAEEKSSMQKENRPF